MKKIVSILLFILMIFSISACNKSNNTSSELDAGVQSDISSIDKSTESTTTSNDLENSSSNTTSSNQTPSSQTPSNQTQSSQTENDKNLNKTEGSKNSEAVSSTTADKICLCEKFMSKAGYPNELCKKFISEDINILNNQNAIVSIKYIFYDNFLYSKSYSIKSSVFNLDIPNNTDWNNIQEVAKDLISQIESIGYAVLTIDNFDVENNTIELGIAGPDSKGTYTVEHLTNGEELTLSNDQKLLFSYPDFYFSNTNNKYLSPEINK